MTYLRIEEVTYGEPVELDLLEALLELDLVEYRREAPQVVLIAEDSCEDIRTMLRLATVLEINPAGVETVMHLRRKVVSLQQELSQLKRLNRD